VSLAPQRVMRRAIGESQNLPLAEGFSALQAHIGLAGDVQANPERLRRSLRRYLLEENWTWGAPDVAARPRASWPTWRRAVRPVEAAAYLLGAIVKIYFQPHAVLGAGGLYVALIAIFFGCAVPGIGHGFRQRRTGDFSRPRLSDLGDLAGAYE
jgi:hypothetical protein